MYVCFVKRTRAHALLPQKYNSVSRRQRQRWRRRRRRQENIHINLLMRFKCSHFHRAHFYAGLLTSGRLRAHYYYFCRSPAADDARTDFLHFVCVCRLGGCFFLSFFSLLIWNVNAIIKWPLLLCHLWAMRVYYVYVANNVGNVRVSSWRRVVMHAMRGAVRCY